MGWRLRSRLQRLFQLSFRWPLIPLAAASSITCRGRAAMCLSLQGPDVAGKRLELLRDIVPGARRLAIMVNVGYPAAKKELSACQAACRALGIEAITLELRRAEDIAAAFDSLHGSAEALYVVSEALVNTNHFRIATLALSARLPTMFGTTDVMGSGV